MSADSFMACPDCDALQSVERADSAAAAETRTHCFRCGALLLTPDGRGGHRADSALAFTLAAIPLFAAGLVAPLVRLRGPEGPIDATVLAAVKALLAQRLPLLAVLVAALTVVLPAFQLASAAYLLAGARARRAPRGAARLIQLLHAIWPFTQAEILLVGLLVAFGKLASIFPIAPGIGVLCLVAFLALQRAARGALEPRRFWERLS